MENHGEIVTIIVWYFSFDGKPTFAPPKSMLSAFFLTGAANPVLKFSNSDFADAWNQECDFNNEFPLIASIRINLINKEIRI